MSLATRVNYSTAIPVLGHCATQQWIVGGETGDAYTELHIP